MTLLDGHQHAVLQAHVPPQHWYPDEQNQGFSLSLWFQLATDNTEFLQPILTIGKSNTSTNREGCPGFYVELAQLGSELVLQYQEANDDVDICRILPNLRSPALSDFSTNQVVITWSSFNTSIYVNGYPVVIGIPSTIDPTSWGPSLSLQLFGNDAEKGENFYGSIAQVTIYNHFLSHNQVLEDFRNGIARSNNQDIVLPEPRVWNNVSLPQDSTDPITILLGSEILSDVTRHLGLRILSLPNLGNLTFQSEAIFVGATVVIPKGEQMVQVNYTLLEDVPFTVPFRNAKGQLLDQAAEFFDLALVLLDDEGEDLAISMSQRQYIDIIQVNHAPILQTPDTVTLPENFTSDALILIDGIKVNDDRDRDVLRIRVDVSAELGKLTLNPQYRYLADFDSCRGRSYSPWQCTGSGFENRNMTFVAVPSDVERILLDLQYQAFYPGRSDKIWITLYDGVENSCLSWYEQRQFVDRLGRPISPIQRECFKVEHAIVIPETAQIEENGQAKDNGLFGIPNTGFKNFGSADLLFWILVISVLGCMCLCLRSICHCARGRPIEADNFSVSSFGESSSMEDYCFGENGSVEITADEPEGYLSGDCSSDETKSCSDAV